MSHIETDEFDAPAHWACAFLNGDCSGLSGEEQAEFDAWCEAHPNLCNVVDCTEEAHIGRFAGLQTELLTYACHLLSEGTR